MARILLIDVDSTIPNLALMKLSALAAWCNQPNIFKKMDWGNYLEQRHPKNPERVKTSRNACYGGG